MWKCGKLKNIKINVCVCFICVLNVSGCCSLSTHVISCQPSITKPTHLNYTLDNSRKILYNNNVSCSETNPMNFLLYDDKEILRGEFSSIYDLEFYVDGVRNSRKEEYPKTPRMSPFDYIKMIGWRMEIVTVEKVAQG